MISLHQKLLRDTVRCQLFQKAIEQGVKKADTVVDIGAGTGLLSFFAVKAGASKVYAIESNPIIEKAKKIAADNKLLDKITFINGVSTQVSLPEKVDVVISETISAFGVEENIDQYLNDARSRFLKENGIIIPAGIQLNIALVEAHDIYHENIGFLDTPLVDINYSKVRDELVNTPILARISPTCLLSDAQTIYQVDFLAAETDGVLAIDSQLTFTVERKGLLHGVCGWFSSQLGQNIMLSNSPQNRSSHWRQKIFPIEQPVQVKRGDLVKVNMSLHPFYGSSIWNWSVEVSMNEKSTDAEKVQYEHSTFKTLSLSKEWLMRQRLDNNFTPLLDEIDQIRLYVLQSCDGHNKTKDIAQKLLQKYPSFFQSSDHALHVVLDITKNCEMKIE